MYDLQETYNTKGYYSLRMWMRERERERVSERVSESKEEEEQVTMFNYQVTWEKGCNERHNASKLNGYMCHEQRKLY